MLVFAKTRYMAINFYIVRWIRKDLRCLLAFHKDIQVLTFERIAAEEAVTSQDPQILQLTDGTASRLRQNFFFKIAVLKASDLQINFAHAKARDL